MKSQFDPLRTILYTSTMNIRRGFTVVELLIVIVVIAILAVITVVAYNGIRDRSQASQIASGITQTEKAFRLWLSDRGDAYWPSDYTDYSAATPANPLYLPSIFGTTVTNPQISVIIASCPGYNAYQQKSPADANPALNWSYDMDNDTKGTTSTTANLVMGTNLVIRNAPLAVQSLVDSSIDDGNNLTGKIRYDPAVSPTAMYYSLSYSRNFN